MILRPGVQALLEDARRGVFEVLVAEGLDRERRASGATDRAELADIEKKIKAMVAVIEDGGYARGMMDRMRELEARQDEIAERLAAVPVDIPDIHPDIAIVYRRKVERLAEALADPRDRDEAAEAIRGLIERIVLAAGEKRGEMHAALHGDLGTILEWAGSAKGKRGTGTPQRGVSVSVVVGACRLAARTEPHGWTFRPPGPASMVAGLSRRRALGAVSCRGSNSGARPRRMRAR